jgi:hypothetical protein
MAFSSCAKGDGHHEQWKCVGEVALMGDSFAGSMPKNAYSGGDILDQGHVDIADITAIVNDFNAQLNGYGL